VCSLSFLFSSLSHMNNTYYVLTFFNLQRFFRSNGRFGFMMKAFLSMQRQRCMLKSSFSSRTPCYLDYCMTCAILSTIPLDHVPWTSLTKLLVGALGEWRENFRKGTPHPPWKLVELRNEQAFVLTLLEMRRTFSKGHTPPRGGTA
jgi:hypothetical protein